jgi:Uma2 family endonuclease
MTSTNTIRDVSRAANLRSGCHPDFSIGRGVIARLATRAATSIVCPVPTALRQRSWEEICADPVLRDLPYKIETNARGQIIMSPPARNEHSAFQQRIASLLERLLPDGAAFTEAATETDDGTRAADVAWTSREHAKAEIKHASWQRSPVVIVEVWSPHNTDAEMSERRALFFAAGAEECWTCDLAGAMRFWAHDGEVAQSRRCPEFPREIVLFG